MEENSIEEDIILLKDFTEGNFKRDKLENYKCSYKMGYFYYKNIQQAIEHILSDYKRVLKENEKIRNGRNRLFEYATAQQTTPEMLNKILRENYISKDKIKEILEETEITDFNSLVEAFLKIKKLLESE